jgi:hypothetical protein
VNSQKDLDQLSELEPSVSSLLRLLVACAEFPAEPFPQSGARIVEADDFVVLAVASVLLGDGVQGCDSGGVSEVGGIVSSDHVSVADKGYSVNLPRPGKPVRVLIPRLWQIY